MDYWYWAIEEKDCKPVRSNTKQSISILKKIYFCLAYEGWLPIPRQCRVKRLNWVRQADSLK